MGDVITMLLSVVLGFLGVMWVRILQREYIWGREFPKTNPIIGELRPEYREWYQDYARRFMQ